METNMFYEESDEGISVICNSCDSNNVKMVAYKLLGTYSTSIEIVFVVKCKQCGFVSEMYLSEYIGRLNLDYRKHWKFV
jgi:hypothetical protein